MNDYREGPFVNTTAGRKVWSFTVFLNECYEACETRSTKVLDLANAEWDHGKKDVKTVKAQHAAWKKEQQ